MILLKYSANLQYKGLGTPSPNYNLVAKVEKLVDLLNLSVLPKCFQASSHTFLSIASKLLDNPNTAYNIGGSAK
jgi:hypothetical protein